MLETEVRGRPSRHAGRMLTTLAVAALSLGALAVPSATALVPDMCVVGATNPVVNASYTAAGTTETNPIVLRFDADGDTATTGDQKVVGSATYGSPSAGQVSVAITGNTVSGGTTYQYEVAICLQGTGAAVQSGWLTDGQSTSPAISVPASGFPTWAYIVREIKSSEGGEWCSPGFWKNNYGAWGPTGYTPASIDAVTGKTFGEILANPKTYAKIGDYERIADILSGAHPGVDFNGTRFANCPLSADEANKTKASNKR